MTNKKICFKCRELKDRECFYNNSNSWDRKCHTCISCEPRRDGPKRRLSLEEKQKRHREYMSKNRHKWSNKKYKDYTIQEKIGKLLRSRIYRVVKRAGAIKSERTMELLGCSMEFFIDHLKSQFTEGMSLENHGEWHIDHIRPCASFDLTDPEQQKQCFHYTNLQPLWAFENLSKGAKYEQ